MSISNPGSFYFLAMKMGNLQPPALFHFETSHHQQKHLNENCPRTWALRGCFHDNGQKSFPHRLPLKKADRTSRTTNHVSLLIITQLHLEGKWTVCHLFLIQHLRQQEVDGSGWKRWRFGRDNVARTCRWLINRPKMKEKLKTLICKRRCWRMRVIDESGEEK